MTRLIKIVSPLVLAIGLAFPFHAAAQSPEDLKRLTTFLQIMSNYLDIIEATHDVASDPEKAAILQMQKLQEIYEQRGEKARVVAELRNYLQQTDNGTIRNAAYMLMSDTLKETGKADEAIELLRNAIAENLKAAR